MRSLMTLALATCILCCTITTLPSQAQAQDTQTQFSIGARIGGYGFRQLNTNRVIDWQNCRMDGVGVYGIADFSNSLYAEVASDFYFANDSTLRQGLDRLSFHVLASGGYRILPDAFITPTIHVGGGAEVSWVNVYGKEKTALLPVGFMGVGGELNIQNFHFGMAIRVHAMQLPEYDWGMDGQHEVEKRKVTFATEMAGQVLFSLRYSI